ncbi:MAG: hypothetical protein N2235_01395 [Fischerella sp.]|nr:hypothetical protein [Fischerella sp.]
MFIDDERFPPGNINEWVIVRSSREAVNYVTANGVPDFISFDHDLGSDDTAMEFVNWLINAHLDRTIQTFPSVFDVHSQNPIGARNIRVTMQRYIDFNEQNTAW